MGPALRLSCRSELHVLPRFPVAQTIRSPDHDELSELHRLVSIRAGVLWLRLPSRDLTPESLRDPTCVGLTLGITRDVPADIVWASPI